MKIKYAIYFFTLCLMTSFSLFIVDELLEAHTDYRDNQLNLYKIDRAKEISEAFQAALQSAPPQTFEPDRSANHPSAMFGRRLGGARKNYPHPRTSGR